MRVDIEAPFDQGAWKAAKPGSRISVGVEAQPRARLLITSRTLSWDRDAGARIQVTAEDRK